MLDKNSHLKAWDEEHKRGIWKGPYSLAFFQKYAPSSGCVLDAGCGIGRYTIPLALKNYSMFGIDISLPAIKKLDDEIHRRNLNVGLGVADVRYLPYNNNVFDIVVCFGVLQHLLEYERQKALIEFNRVLAQNGTLIMEVLGKEDMRAGGKMVEPSTYQRNTGSIYHYFDVQELTDIFSDFKIIEIKEEKVIKNLGGKECMRHMISAAAKSVEKDK
ncbi:MAG: class I SAM-dependent methyltransferase [Methanosarcinales archaeon]|nr:class I SAM-dependent methyltransferase [Methanosarcinales archaeon]